MGLGAGMLGRIWGMGGYLEWVWECLEWAWAECLESGHGRNAWKWAWGLGGMGGMPGMGMPGMGMGGMPLWCGLGMGMGGMPGMGMPGIGIYGGLGAWVACLEWE